MIDFSSAATSPNLVTAAMQNPNAQNSNSFRSASNSATAAAAAVAAVNSMQHPFGPIGGSSPVGGGSGTNRLSDPPSLDLNEFPSLGGANINTSSTTGRPPYVGMVKDNVTNISANNEFNIQPEDFPALPGANAASAAAIVAAAASGGNGGNVSSFQSFLNANQMTSQNLADSSALQTATSNNNQISSSQQNNSVNDSSITTTTNFNMNSSSQQQPPSSLSLLTSHLQSKSNLLQQQQQSVGNKSSMQITKDGHVMNIPSGMMTDQYGIAGLVAMLQSVDNNPTLRQLILGFDIQEINMNLNSKDSRRLYPTFPGPWNDKRLNPYEIDYPVPSEYMIYNNVRDKLAKIKLQGYSDDLLFFLFYFFAGEQLQLLASQELCQRDWRYYTGENIWITRKQGYQPIEKSSLYERGQYLYFDPLTWSKATKEMIIDYERLEKPSFSSV